jgi:hypothetical protein
MHRMAAKRLKNRLERYARYLYRSRKTILLIIVVASITIVVNALVAFMLSKPAGWPIVWVNQSSLNVTSNTSVQNVGGIYVTGVEAYGGDITYRNGIATLDWGTFYLGNSKNASFYLRSISTSQIRLALNVTNWNPEGLKHYMTLTWDYTGTQIDPNEEIPVRLTLSLSSSTDLINYLITNKVTTFSFNINVYPQSP